MNYGCWYAIVRSEKTHTLARNEFQVLMCHHAVRKDTHAGLQRILWHAPNYGCGSAIGCNEWRLLIRHRAVRKDTHAGLQRLPSANVPSCGQKLHRHRPQIEKVGTDGSERGNQRLPWQGTAGSQTLKLTVPNLGTRGYHCKELPVPRS